MSARPKKSFGQHFLHERRYIERIVSAISPRPDDFLIEIGPGEGALTFPLLAAAGKLTAIELDTDLIPNLQANAAAIGELSIVHADVLKVDFTAMAHRHGVSQLRIAGNLPYYISSPICSTASITQRRSPTCTSCCRKKSSIAWRQSRAAKCMDVCP